MPNKILDIELPSSGFALKNLSPDRLLVLGHRNGKELGVLLDITAPDSWVQSINILLECFSDGGADNG